MADDKNFKALVEEQKKATVALNKIAGINAEETDAVKSQGEKRERSAAELKADESRSEKMTAKWRKKNSLLGKTVSVLGKVFGASKGKDKEKSKDEKKSGDSRFKKLGSILLTPLTKIKDSLMGYGKKAVAGIGTLFKFGIMGAALVLIKNFLESDTWKKWQTDLIPALVVAFDFISATLKLAGETIVTGIKAFKKLLTLDFFDADGNFIGIGASFTLLKEAVAGLGVALVGLGLLLAPKALLFSAVKLAIGTVFKALKIFRLFLSIDTYKAIVNMVTGAASKVFMAAIATVRAALKIFRLFLSIDTYKAIIALVASGAKGAGGAILGAVSKVGKALTALRLFMMTSLLPGITAMLAGFAPLLVPLLIVVGVVAAVLLVIASIKNAFDDFKATLDETGSIFEALKVGFASLVANVLGLIPNLLLDFVAWIFEKLGWTQWAAKLKEIDVVSFIKNGLLTIFTKLGEFVGKIYDDYIKPLLAPLLKFFDPVINIVKKVFNFLLDAIQPVIDFISKIAKKIGGFIKKIAKKLNPLNWFGGGDDEKVENLDDVVSSGTAAQMEIDKSEKEDMVTALPRATIVDESDYTPSPEMQAAMAETTVISAPVSNVTNNPTTQVVSRTVIEPDVYFIRQSSWAI